MTNLQQYKIIVGSDNDVIYEDPILGSNGTAVVTKINNLIDAIDLANTGTLPLDTGYLVTKNNSGVVAQLPPGPNRFCLVSNTSSTMGLGYEERVDLSSAQTIGGNKTLTGATAVASLSASGAVNIAGTTTANSVSLTNLIASGTATVAGPTQLNSSVAIGGNASLASQLDVTGNTLLRGNLIVNQATTLSGATNIGSNLGVVGNVSLASNLTVGGSTTLQGPVVTNSSLLVGSTISANGGLSVGGNTNLNGNLTVLGPSLIDDNLSVTGTLSTNDLAIANDLSVGGDLSVVGNTTTTGPISTTSSITAGSRITSGGDLVVTTDLSVGRNIDVAGDVEITDDLVVGGDSNLVNTTTNTLTVVGNTNLNGQVQVGQNLQVAGNTSSAGSLVVGGSAAISSNLDVDGYTNLDGLDVEGVTNLTGPLTLVGNATITGSTTIGQDLAVDGNSTIDGNSLVSGNSTTTGTSTTTDLVVLTDASVIGDLSAANVITFRAEVNGDLSVDGSTTLSGPTNIDDTLVVTGTITGSNLSGTNTGDELPATSTTAGIVKTDSNSLDPIVYLKDSVDALFVMVNKLGAPNGVATLDSASKIPASQLPAISITDVFVVGSEAAMLALTAQVGDVAKRTDENKTYILRAEPASNLSNWEVMLFPEAPVQSVHGRTGDVVAATNDYTALQVSIDSSSFVLTSSTHVQGAVGEIDAEVSLHLADLDNPHEVTAAQVGALAITQLGVANGVASLDANAKLTPTQLPDGLALYYILDFTSADLVNNVLTVTHNLGKKRLSSVLVWNNADKVVIPDDVLAIDANTLSIALPSFNDPTPIIGSWSVAVVK